MAGSTSQMLSMSSDADFPIDNLPVSYRAPDERRFWRKVRRVVARVPFVEDSLDAWIAILGGTLALAARSSGGVWAMPCR